MLIIGRLFPVLFFLLLIFSAQAVVGSSQFQKNTYADYCYKPDKPLLFAKKYHKQRYEDDMLEYQLAQWQLDPNPHSKINYKTTNIRVAYSATTLFVFLAMASSLAVFVPIYWLTTVVGAVVVFPTALLIWVQMGSMLEMLSVKGLEAVDLDLVFPGDPKPKSKKSTPTEA